MIRIFTLSLRRRHPRCVFLLEHMSMDVASQWDEGGSALTQAC